MRGGAHVSLECRIARADGTWFWNEVRLSRGTDSDGRDILQSICMDISVRRERESQQYGRILLSSFDEVFLWDYKADTSQTLKGIAPDSHEGIVMPGMAEMQRSWVSSFVAPEYRAGC